MGDFNTHQGTSQKWTGHPTKTKEGNIRANRHYKPKGPNRYYRTFTQTQKSITSTLYLRMFSKIDFIFGDIAGLNRCRITEMIPCTPSDYQGLTFTQTQKSITSTLYLRTFSKIVFIFGYKVGLNRCKITEMIPCTTSDYQGLKMNISNNRNKSTLTNSWKLNDFLLNKIMDQERKKGRN